MSERPEDPPPTAESQAALTLWALADDTRTDVTLDDEETFSTRT
jgi:hypothetical protein